MDREAAARDLMGKFQDQTMTLEEREDDTIVSIINPFGGDNIKVYLDEVEMTFFYATQHAHFGYGEMEDLSDYIDGFLRGETVDIEFFRDGEDIMGGSQDFADIHLSSAESMVGLFEEGFPHKIKKKMLKWYRTGEWKVMISHWDCSRDQSVCFRWKGNCFETDAPVQDMRMSDAGPGEAQ